MQNKIKLGKVNRPYTTLGDIKRQIRLVEERGYDIDAIPVLLTDDDEMNGIHTAWKNEGLVDGIELKNIGRFSHLSLPREFDEIKDKHLFYLVG